MHASWGPIMTGIGVTAVVSFAAIAWSLRGLARSSPRALLAGVIESRTARTGRARVLTAAAAGSLAGAMLVLAASARGTIASAEGFFGAGTLLLVSTLSLTALVLRRAHPRPIGGRGWRALGRLAFMAGNFKWALSLLEQSAQKQVPDAELQFDLARAYYSMGRVGDAEATLAAISEKGVVLGTVAYMSPEQARGSDVDFRSDQFSLGVVLYEMLSGGKPFDAASVPETLTAIIRDEPEPLEKRAPHVPAPIRWLVERLLSKEASERYDATRDIVRELKGLRDRLSTWTQAAPAAGPASKAALRWIPLAAGGALLLVLGAALGRRTAPPSLPPPRLTYITSSGQDGAPAISPDGRLCAFASSRDGVSRIWLKQLVDGSEIALTEGPDQAPRFTPDSTSVFFVRDKPPPGGVLPGAPAPAAWPVAGISMPGMAGMIPPGAFVPEKA